ncbi:unnamed protein product [Lampetra fluviatilis]
MDSPPIPTACTEDACRNPGHSHVISAPPHQRRQLTSPVPPAATINTARIIGIAQQLSHTPSLLHHDNHPSGPAQRATTRLPVPAAPRPKPHGVVVVETVAANPPAASPSALRGDEREETAAAQLPQSSEWLQGSSPPPYHPK